jgi:hypothetical protein
MEVGQPRVRLDRVFAALEALPDALEAADAPGRGAARARDQIRLVGARAGSTAARNVRIP